MASPATGETRDVAWAPGAAAGAFFRCAVHGVLRRGLAHAFRCVNDSECRRRDTPAGGQPFARPGTRRKCHRRRGTARLDCYDAGLLET